MDSGPDTFIAPLRSAGSGSLLSLQYEGLKVGFPIRRSLDHSLFAAPQGLSQRTTSFIASQRQGIHQMLLRHLIALMIDVRPDRQQFGLPPVTRPRSQKDQRQDPLGSRRCMLAERIRSAALADVSDAFPLHDVKHPRRGTNPPGTKLVFPRARPPLDATPVREWWSWTGSNRRPHACKARALPTELQPR